jgi:hypothetical protein
MESMRAFVNKRLKARPDLADLVVVQPEHRQVEPVVEPVEVEPLVELTVKVPRPRKSSNQKNYTFRLDRALMDSFNLYCNENDLIHGKVIQRLLKKFMESKKEI